MLKTIALVIGVFALSLPLTAISTAENNIKSSDETAQYKVKESHTQKQETLKKKKIEQKRKVAERKRLEAIRAKKAEERRIAKAEAEKAQSVEVTPQIQAPAPTYAVGCEQYRPLLQKYGWSVNEAMLVMQKESGCNPNVVSPTNDHGLFQLNGQPVYEPSANVAIAWQKYIGRGNWSAWYAVCPYSGGSPYGLNCG